MFSFDPQGSNPAELIYGVCVLVVMGGISTAFGVALAFEREPRRWRVGASWMGLRTNAKGILWFLMFFMAGLFLFGGMLMPGVIPWSWGGVVISLVSTAAGGWGLRAIYKRRRGQRERSLKAAKKVAEARELFGKECEPKYEIYAEALGAVVENNVSKARDSGKNIITLCNWLLVIHIILLGFFFIYGFFVPLTAFMERLTRKPVVFKD